MKTFRSFSSAETKKFAERLAKKSIRSKKRRREALVFALTGELGSGKTTFAQGFFRGLGIKKRAVSPTFILFRRLALHHPRFKNVYHVDAYRIKKSKELLKIGFKEILNNPQNIILIEWADRIKKILPKNTIIFHFIHGNHPKERKIY